PNSSTSGRMNGPMAKRSPVDTSDTRKATAKMGQCCTSSLCSCLRVITPSAMDGVSLPPLLFCRRDPALVFHRPRELVGERDPSEAFPPRGGAHRRHVPPRGLVGER